MNKSILIAGGSGFIGRKLGKFLSEKGYQIRILSQSSKLSSNDFDFPCELFLWNPNENKIAQRAMSGVQIVINLAGAGLADQRWSTKYKKLLIDSRINSTQTLLNAIAETHDNSVNTFINASAIGFYGDTGSVLVDESAESGTDFLADLCRRWEHSFFKVSNEKLKNKTISNEKESYRKVVLRIGLVLSSEGGALAKMLPAFKLGVGGVLGKGTQWMSWIHINDLLNLFSFIIADTKISGVVNAVAPSPVNNIEYTKSLGRALHRPTILNVPSIALKLALGEMSQVLLTGQKVSSKKILEAGFKFQFDTLESAFNNLFKS